MDRGRSCYIHITHNIRVLAADMLRREPTNWHQWIGKDGMHKLGSDAEGRVVTGEGWHNHEADEGFGQEHVHDIVRSATRRAKWAKTPRIRGRSDSCRIFGSLSVNKVMGDFHITARGHGYMDFGSIPTHLNHDTFNFSHIISEMSFGAFYPSLVNPLDRTVAATPVHFHRFQYYLSVVPTTYTVGSPSSPLFPLSSSSTVITNQYAVTEQSHQVSEQTIPGIFFKYDIEPILLNIEESRDSFLRFCVKIVNIFSGVLVAGHWGFTISEWLKDVVGRRRARNKNDGVLNGRVHLNEE